MVISAGAGKTYLIANVTVTSSENKEIRVSSHDFDSRVRRQERLSSRVTSSSATVRVSELSAPAAAWRVRHGRRHF